MWIRWGKRSTRKNASSKDAGSANERFDLKLQEFVIAQQHFCLFAA